jgi:geranylgeranyl diphosphate synthase type II
MSELPSVSTTSEGERAGRQAFVLESYLAECRQVVLDEIRRLIPEDTGGRALYDLIMDYPLREAKGLRPALAIATCRGFGGKTEAILPTAAVLELYHNAFLIHDDVEDDSLMRRGRTTLHQEHGIPVAVNVGDAMLALSLEPLLKNMAVIGLGPSLLILQAVARMSRESVEGQALELDWIRRGAWNLADADYVTMVTKKTGWYSFITPMLVGALAAGVVSNERTEALTAFGQALGVAFQIQDDILNLAGEVQGYGKEIGGDLWEGKRTVIVLHALRQASPAERQRAVEILSLGRPSSVAEAESTHVEQLLEELHEIGELSATGRARLRTTLFADRNVKTLQQVQWLRALIERTGSLDYARAVASFWANQASSELERLSRWLPPSIHRSVLESLVDYVHRRAK